MLERDYDKPCSLQENSDLLKTDGTFGYAYDENGNLIRKGTEFRDSYAGYVIPPDETLYSGTDHQGTTVLMTDEAGVKVWTSEATPFGDAIVTKTGDRDDLALKYTGKDLDEDTGLYYYNARWYDAGTGRFISEDPARDGANWFIYCSNNPLKYIDPTGMWSSSGSANDNPYDKGGDADQGGSNQDSGSKDPAPDNGGNNNRDSDGNNGSKPEEKDKPITTPVIGPPPEITPGIGVPKSADKILTDLGIGEDLGESSIPVTGGTSGGSSGDGSTTPPTEEPLDGSNELPPKPEGTDGDSGWSAYAGAEMIGLGALIAGTGIVTGNIPMAIAGGIAIVAGSELARTGNINNTTETIYEFSKFISNKMNPGRKGQR